MALLQLIADVGFVYESEAVYMLQTEGVRDGEKAMKTLVYHNLLQYRPNTEQSYDLPARITRRNEPVLSSPSPVALYILRQAIELRCSDRQGGRCGLFR